jgi:hypothetical protein
MAGRDPFVEVPRLLASVAALRVAGAAQVAADRARFVTAVTGAPELQTVGGPLAGAVAGPVPQPA